MCLYRVMRHGEQGDFYPKGPPELIGDLGFVSALFAQGGTLDVQRQILVTQHKPIGSPEGAQHRHAMVAVIDNPPALGRMNDASQRTHHDIDIGADC